MCRTYAGKLPLKYCPRHGHVMKRPHTQVFTSHMVVIVYGNVNLV